MKILYFFAENNSVMLQWQRFHIINELSQHNCEINIFNPNEYNDWTVANEALLKYIKGKDYDLFMTPHTDEKVLPETIIQIKKMGIPTLLFCPDNLVIPYWYKNICKHFDLVWLTSKETKYLFDRWKASSIFLPYAANPSYFQANYQNEIDKVCFLGTPYGSRINVINTLLDKKIDLCLFANIDRKQNNDKQDNQYYIFDKQIQFQPSFKHHFDDFLFPIGRKLIKGFVVNKLINQELLAMKDSHLELRPSQPLKNIYNIYNKYALTLSITAARNTGVLKSPLNIINLRSFEIPMAGGLQFCSYFEELSQYFEEDAEIIFYRSKEEMVDKAKYYLDPKRHDLRVRMKIAARKRAVNEHTWFLRFSKVFDFLGLNYQ